MTPKRWMLLTIAAACAALPAFGAANDTVTVTVTGELRQPVHFGIDAERLWFFWPERREQLAEMAVGRLKVDFARVAINGAYGRWIRTRSSGTRKCTAGWARAARPTTSSTP